MNRCPACRAEVIVYDWDANLVCYLGPDLVDPTPLTVDLAVACRVTGRDLYTHRRDRVGRRHMSRLWARPLPADLVVLPRHQCGARIPTRLAPLTDRTALPAVCPF